MHAISVVAADTVQDKWVVFYGHKDGRIWERNLTAWPENVQALICGNSLCTNAKYALCVKSHNSASAREKDILRQGFHTAKKIFENCLPTNLFAYSKDGFD